MKPLLAYQRSYRPHDDPRLPASTYYYVFSSVIPSP